MAIEWVREYCLSMPQATETVQWGNDLVFKIAGKMFAVLPLEPGGLALSFKCSAAQYTELIEQPGIIPAPYLARAHWVALENPRALSTPELKKKLREAYDEVVAKLPKSKRPDSSKPTRPRQPSP